MRIKSFKDFLSDQKNGGWYIEVYFRKFNRTFDIPYRDAKTEKSAKDKAVFNFVVEYGKYLMNLTSPDAVIYNEVINQHKDLLKKLKTNINRVPGIE